MSFQRIFETARRMGSPLVITDPAGREPMVVMTLEAFERMGDGLPVTSRKSKVESQPMPQTQEQEVVTFIEVMKEPEKAQVSEISMEERFFIEPE
jgi:hypothetical protein